VDHGFAHAPRTPRPARVGYAAAQGGMPGRAQTRDHCLAAGELADFVAGALAAGEAAAIERHVARCADCRTLLSLVARSDSRAPRSWAASASSLGTMPAAGEPAAALVEGTRVGRYVLRSRLGAGAMGVVFTAHDPELDREIAIKLLRGDLDADMPRLPLAARMVAEAQAMARLAHPNVVAVHDVGWFGDHIFIAMELVQGETLAQWLAAGRRARARADVLAMFIAAGTGLAAAHAAGLVHRDFKPENVLVGRDGRVRVTDFGLADRAAVGGAPVAHDDERPVRLVGTPFYMAPEQLAGDPVDARGDQFGFCVAIYAALTGAHPLRGEGGATARPPRAGLPGWLWRTLARGLATDRARRFATMDDLLAELGRGQRRQRGQRRIAGGAVAAIIATAGIAFAAARLTAPTPAPVALGAAVGPRCEGAAGLLAGVWDPTRAHTVEAAFRASQRPGAIAGFTAASLLLDQYANRWIAMRTEACARARLDGLATDAVADLRIDCLDARKSELRVFTDRLVGVGVGADAALVDGAAVAARGLGSLAVCADDAALARRRRPEVIARPDEVLAVDGDGRTSEFGLDRHGVLWQVRARADGRRERVQVIDAVMGRPAIVVDADHQLQVFVRRAEDLVWHMWQGADGAWQREQLADRVPGEPTAIAVGRQLVYFVRRNDGWLWRFWQSAAAPGGWVATPVTEAASGRPSAALDVHGELYSFVRKADGSLWSAHHRGPDAPADQPTKLNEAVDGDPIAIRDALGKLTFFIRHRDGYLLTGYQETAGSPIWHRVKFSDQVAGDPALAFDPDSKQVCMMRLANGDVWSAIQRAPGFGPWDEAIVSHHAAHDPSLALAGDQRLTFVVRQADDSLVEGRQTLPRAMAWQARAVDDLISDASDHP
jgi:hypothetical protein